MEGTLVYIKAKITQICNKTDLIAVKTAQKLFETNI